MDTHPTSIPSPTRILLAAAVALLVALMAVGLGGSPASALAPGATDIVGNVGYDVPGPSSHHRLIWAPDTGGEDVTGYQIERWNQAKSQKIATYNTFGTNPEPTYTITGVPDEIVYQYRVRTQNADGWGP